MKFLADRLNAFSESKSIAMGRKAREIAAQGHEVVKLNFGEPDFDTPDYVKEAAAQAMNAGVTKYTPIGGFPELKQAICDKFKRENNLTYTPDQVIVSTGGKQSIMNAILALVNPGEEVLIPSPFWVSYPDMVKIAGGTPKYIKTSAAQNYKVSAQQLEEAISPNTKLLIFSSPCNPSGAMLSKDEMDAWVEVLEKHPNIFIISDEIYEHITYDHKHLSIASYSSIYDRVITVNGVSKCFAMTGWRIGYMAAHSEIVKACEKIQGQFTSGANSIAQKAAEAALKGGLDFVGEMTATFEKRKNLMYQRLANIEGVKVTDPEGAFYLFPDVSEFFGKTVNGKTLTSSDDLAMFLLEQHHLAVVPGDAFGDPNSIRISFAASETELNKALDILETALNEIK